MTEPSPIDLSGLLQLTLAFVGLLAGFGFAAAMQHFATWLQLDREAKAGLTRAHHAVELLKRRLNNPNEGLEDLRGLLEYYLSVTAPSFRAGAGPAADGIRRALRRLRFPDQRISAIVLNLVAQTAFDRDDPEGAAAIVDVRTAWRAFKELNVEGISSELPAEFSSTARSELTSEKLLALQAEVRGVAGSSQNARHLWYLMFGTFLLSGVLMIVGLTLLRHGIDRGVVLSIASRTLLKTVVLGFSLVLGLALLIATAVTGAHAIRRIAPKQSRSLAEIACDPNDDHPGWLTLDVVFSALFLACVYWIALIAGDYWSTIMACS